MNKVSHIEVIGSLVYKVSEKLRNDSDFLERLSEYRFYENSFDKDGNFSLWHYVGTQNEISNALVNIATKTNKFQYPSLLNIQPCRQNRTLNHTEIEYSLVFVAPVESEWSTEERDKFLFEPLLRPLYAEFLKQIDNSRYFFRDYDPVPHTYYENFATGGESGVILEKYGNYLSAVELHKLQLKLRNQLCDDQIEQIKKENYLASASIKI